MFRDGVAGREAAHAAPIWSALVRFPSVSFSVLLTITLTSAVSHADFVGNYTVGTGAHSSTLQFQFTNGNAYHYEVFYNDTLHGRDLFTIVAAAQPGFFSYQIESFSFGDALLGVTIGSDSDAGFGTAPEYLDYWHYWTMEAGQGAWSESFIGFGDRLVTDGSSDGWVFNSLSAPEVVPAPSALALLSVLPKLCLSGASRDRRRHRESQRR